MTLNPTLKAPSSMRRNGVRTMVMGGQACVYYGAAEFSRDLDLLVLADPANLLCLRGALAELETKPIAVPELELRHLERGLAVHFRSEREADRVYWQPLKRELEWLRLHRAREAGTDDNP